LYRILLLDYLPELVDRYRYPNNVASPITYYCSALASLTGKLRPHPAVRRARSLTSRLLGNARPPGCRFRAGTLAPGLRRILMTTSARPRDDRFGPEVIMLQLI
jgi:hypothetical protein